MKKVITILPALVLSLMLFEAGEALSGESESMTGITNAHNDVRSALNIPELIWSDKIADVAQDWASHLAKNNKCKMQHRPRKGRDSRHFGENIYWASALKWSDGRRDVQRISPTTVVNSWAIEVEDYDYSRNSCQTGKVCGHYTQLVWKDSAQLGCGMAACSDKGQIWVCNYDPPGNHIGRRPY
ncbi:MAG TPA: CAP domain-containing protein [Mariprofundaceae bacterium]|nr:CAP domain-containing protein [Mariprofundaceae bacterium]